MPNVQPIRPLFANPAGRLKLTKKPARSTWFDGRELQVAALRMQKGPSRAIMVSVSGPTGKFHLPLSGSEAAHLMFEIGYALEQAADDGRTH